MEEKEQKKKFNKKLMIPLISMILIGSIFAMVYIVKSYNVTVPGVNEAFNVSYQVMPLNTNCSTISNWNYSSGSLYK